MTIICSATEYYRRPVRNQHSTIKLCFLALCSMMVALRIGATGVGEYLGPCVLASSKDGKTLYVANADANQIFFVDIHSGEITCSIGMPDEPTDLTLNPEGTKLYVSCASPQSTIVVVDTVSGKVNAKIAVGHTACGSVVTPDGKWLYVCNRFDNDVSVIDLKTNEEMVRIPALREPLDAAVTSDGKSILVVNHLPTDRADANHVAAAVTIIDTQTKQTTMVHLPNGATGLRGISMSLNGKYAYVTHILARYELPAREVDYGWMNANALSIIDTKQKRLIGTVLLDDKNLGAANPWGITCTANGKWICVTHAGTHELSVIDSSAFLEKLLAIPVKPGSANIGEIVYDDRNRLLDYFRRMRAQLKGKEEDNRELYTLGSIAGVSNDLTFLVGLRRRIKLKGKGPRGLVVIGSKAYVAEYFTDTLGIVELERESCNPVTQLALGPKPQLTVQRRGEMLLNDAELCYQHWQSCASCHPDARTDGLNWDLINDGIGNLMNTKSLFLAHKTPPAMSSGVRVSAEAAVRAGIKHILFTHQSEQDAEAIDKYLKSFESIPSPHLIDGQLSPAAEQGEKLFFSKKVGCSTCHPAPLYTDMQMHNVDSKSPCDRRLDFDTPTLLEVWRTAPYLHDGRYTTIKELIIEDKHGKECNNVDLNERQINNLVKFVLSL